MPHLPRDPAFDCTLRLLADPYRYISRRRRELGSDAFETRLMLESAVCMVGGENARLFYDPALFVRAGAMPRRVRRTLVGEGGVQTQDGAAHANSKAMFMSALTGLPAARVVDLLWAELEERAAAWLRLGDIVFYEEIKMALTRVACRFAGMPLPDAEQASRMRDLALLFEGAAAVGPRHWRARLARSRAERWIGQFVEAVRRGETRGLPDGAAKRIALHLDETRRLLPAHTAAVEILNVLRPIVAIAVYAVFVAHALHGRAESLERIAAGDDPFTRSFVHEVRRFYPFFPTVGARAARHFDFRGTSIPKGRLFLLDLFGTCHDERIYERPDRFDPARFLNQDPGLFSLIPQGGGAPDAGHRCAGEEITIVLMMAVARFLAQRIKYELPSQDLSLDWRSPPAVPRDGLRMRIHPR